MTTSKLSLLVLALGWLGAPVSFRAADPPLLLAHYMPWYATRDVSGAWGWHWTMNKFNPEQLQADGRRQIASHDYPLIGPYDSGDAHTLECHALLLKLAGFDGVIVDWYGTNDFNDYGLIHRNTTRLLPFLKRAGLKFAVCYEDQSIGHMIKGGKLNPADAIAQGKQTLQWLEKNWFHDPAYVQFAGHPLLLVFGPQHYSRNQWDQLRVGLTTSPMFHVLPHLVPQLGGAGSFGWPPVTGGKTIDPASWKADLNRLYARRQQAESVISIAFPGFKDIYKEAGLHDSYGFIDHRNGKTFEETLSLALHGGGKCVQVATWNDYGEGTVIEPTRDHGYRYLETVQRQRQPSLGGAPCTPENLRLPVEIYLARKSQPRSAETTRILDEAAGLLFASQCTAARHLLDQLKSRPQP